MVGHDPVGESPRHGRGVSSRGMILTKCENQFAFKSAFNWPPVSALPFANST